MSVELPILYERHNPSEPALVLKVGEPNNLDHPKIRSVVEKIGLSPDEFSSLLNTEIDTTKREPVFNTEGVQIELISSSVVNSSIGKVAVSDVYLFPEVVTGKDDMSLHLKTSENLPGFESIYVLEGKAVLSFPETVDPAGGLYTASSKRQSIELAPGTLAIIPAPTANAWSEVGENFHFRYICNPPWSRDIVAAAYDLDSSTTEKRSELVKSSGRKDIAFSELPFGFASEEEFTGTVSNYILELKDDLALSLQELKLAGEKEEKLKTRMTKQVERYQEEIEELQKRMKDPTVFFAYFKGIYDKAVSLENMGLPEDEVFEQFFNDEKGIYSILGLLEHGINQRWGYHFAQRFIAARMMMLLKQERSK